MNPRFWIIFGIILFLTGLIVGALQVALAFRQLDLPGGPDPYSVSVPLGLPISIALVGIIIASVGALRSIEHRKKV